MSCLLCCFRCLSCLGCRDCLLKNTAFHPPPERYEFGQENTKDQGLITTIVSKDSKGQKVAPDLPKGLDVSYFYIPTKTNNYRPAVFLKNHQNKSNFVLLYSHGNSTDLNKMRIMLEDLAIILNVHLIAYEYQGYGPSKADPSDLQMTFDIMSVYEFLIDKLKFKWNEIILYGRSIGSGPTTYLASHPKYPVIGVILHAPFASGLRIFKFDQKSTLKNDLFPNIDFIEHVKAYVYIMHGTDDVEVPIKHSKALSGKVQKLFDTWWVDGGTHNDIDYKFRSSYYIRIAKFLQFLKTTTEGKSKRELEELFQVEDWHQNSSHIYFTEAPKLLEKAKLMPSTRPKDFRAFELHRSFLSVSSSKEGEFPKTTNEDDEERKEYVPPSLSDKKDIEMSFSYSSKKGDLLGDGETDRKMLDSDGSGSEKNLSTKRSKANSNATE